MADMSKSVETLRGSKSKKAIKPYSAAWVHRNEKIKAAREDALQRSMNDPFSEISRHRESFKHDKTGLSSGMNQQLLLPSPVNTSTSMSSSQVRSSKFSFRTSVDDPEEEGFPTASIERSRHNIRVGAGAAVAGGIVGVAREVPDKCRVSSSTVDSDHVKAAFRALTIRDYERELWLAQQARDALEARKRQLHSTRGGLARAVHNATTASSRNHSINGNNGNHVNGAPTSKNKSRLWLPTGTGMGHKSHAQKYNHSDVTVHHAYHHSAHASLNQRGVEVRDRSQHWMPASKWNHLLNKGRAKAAQSKPEAGNSNSKTNCLSIGDRGEDESKATTVGADLDETMGEINVTVKSNASTSTATTATSATGSAHTATRSRNNTPGIGITTNLPKGKSQHTHTQKAVSYYEMYASSPSPTKSKSSALTNNANNANVRGSGSDTARDRERERQR